MTSSGINLTSPAITEYDVPVTETARYIVACRASYGEQRDDIVVDFLAATCR